jgi:uncharacterized protein (DUF58 family)
VPVPTRRLALLAAALSAAVLVLPLRLPFALLVVDGLLLLVAAVDWRLAPPPSSLGVGRSLPAVLPLGGAGAVTWRVANPHRRALVVGLADDLAPSLAAGTRRAHLAPPAGGVASAGTTIRPTRRGRFEPSSVTLRVEGPLGLAARQATVPLPAVLRVHPRYRSREQAELRIERARILEIGLRSAKGRGSGTEFEALRDYSVDDETRRIDWAATARTGRPIVRTYRAERNQTVLCLLDLGRTMAARVEDVPRVEHAMDAVMMLTHVAGRLGDRVGLLAFDAEVRAVVPPRGGPHQLRRVTEAMYDLEPVLVESDHRLAFGTALGRFRRRSLVVLSTELAEQALEDTLLPALPLLLRDHLVVVASVVDPAVAAWASARPVDAGDAYRRAAAITALEERRRVVARLRGMGATVVDAAPGDLAPRLTDTYLKVKATGRL